MAQDGADAGQGRFYLRLHAADRPGSMAAVTRELAQAEISIERIIQTAAPAAADTGNAAGRRPVALLTHATGEAAMRRALDGLAGRRDIVAAPLLLRVEER